MLRLLAPTAQAKACAASTSDRFDCIESGQVDLAEVIRNSRCSYLHVVQVDAMSLGAIASASLPVSGHPLAIWGLTWSLLER